MYASILLSALGIVLLSSTLPRNRAPRPWRNLAWDGAKVGLCMAGMGVLLLGVLMSLLTGTSITERVLIGGADVCAGRIRVCDAGSSGRNRFLAH